MQRVLTCMSGYLDCDQNISNGCEVDMNAMHVIACTSKEFTCETGYADCDTKRSNGCVDGVCLSCTTYSQSSNNLNELCYTSADVSGVRVSTLTFPRAIYIGSLTMNNNTNMTKLELPNLRSAGSINIQENSSLKSIVFDQFENSDRIIISNNTSLSTIDMHALVKIGSSNFSYISYNDALTTLLLTSLSTIGKLEISNNKALTSLDFPSLMTIYQSLRIWSNASLETLRFPILSYVFALTIKYNSSLASTCAPSDYRQVGSGITFTDNYNNGINECH